MLATCPKSNKMLCLLTRFYDNVFGTFGFLICSNKIFTWFTDENFASCSQICIVLVLIPVVTGEIFFCLALSFYSYILPIFPVFCGVLYWINNCVQFWTRLSIDNNKGLVEHLLKFGSLKSNKVAEVMDIIDRGCFVPEGNPPYVDSPMPIGQIACI
ncbi:hypothetical protein HPP92_020210 [Vanilla planifolia]|uniref:Uncharacterized protein n=1 Tax=Vanilla planifolia TaxID=51239 RepID=A0A835ULU8_VANPL|nr:hypothetical protein HPP92_020210 [Vanilla planifolia]